MQSTSKYSNMFFGLTFSAFFLIISFFIISINNYLFFLTLFIAIIFFVLGIFNSKYLTLLNVFWQKFGILLGKIVAPIVMLLIFFLVVTPIGIIMKILKKDLLNIKYLKSNSYWIKREHKINSMKKQF